MFEFGEIALVHHFGHQAGQSVDLAFGGRRLAFRPGTPGSLPDERRLPYTSSSPKSRPELA